MTPTPEERIAAMEPFMRNPPLYSATQCATAIREAVEAERAWLPIEGAPLTGEAVLTYMPPLPHQDCGWINIQKWKGVKAGWVSVGQPKRRMLHQPTHWRPLPPQPAIERAEHAGEGAQWEGPAYEYGVTWGPEPSPHHTGEE